MPPPYGMGYEKVLLVPFLIKFDITDPNNLKANWILVLDVFKTYWKLNDKIHQLI